MHGPFALLLIQADDSPLVAGELRLLLAEHLALIRIVFDEQDEDRSEDEGVTAGAEEGYEVQESRRVRQGRGKVRPDHRGRE